MKLCPQCAFLYENDQSVCDMDGRELVRTAPLVTQQKDRQQKWLHRESGGSGDARFSVIRGSKQLLPHPGEIVGEAGAITPADFAGNPSVVIDLGQRLAGVRPIDITVANVTELSFL